MEPPVIFTPLHGLLEILAEQWGVCPDTTAIDKEEFDAFARVMLRELIAVSEFMAAAAGAVLSEQCFQDCRVQVCTAPCPAISVCSYQIEIGGFSLSTWLRLGYRYQEALHPASFEIEAAFYQAAENSLRSLLSSHSAEVMRLLEGFSWSVGDAAHELIRARGRFALEQLQRMFAARPSFTEAAIIETSFAGQLSAARATRAFVALAALFDAARRHAGGDPEYEERLVALSRLSESW